MLSIWSDTENIKSFNPLTKDINTDVLIIGGGICGVLCAYMLKQYNINYVLVDADTICNGITKNTTAKITSQHGLIYNKLIHLVGVEKAQMYLDANELALKKYTDISKNIDCDFQQKDAFVYSLNDTQKIEDEIISLNRIGFNADFVENLPLPFSTLGAIKFKNQAQFNPLKFISAISKDLNIFENTMVKKIDGTTAITNQGNIKAKKIIVTTHFPFINKHGSYFLKMYQHRSYVIAFKNSPQLNGMYVDEAQNGMSFRNYKNMLFIGGGDHRTGKTGGGWNELSNFANKYYPNAEERYRWATQDCMTLDSIPYIGKYSKSTPNLYVATGFNKWGMTSSMISAIILSDMVLGKSNPYADVFSPSRTMLRPQLLVNMFEATKNLITPSKRRCSHMGCALKWNKYEHTWDCTCHGSRFTQTGKLIDNPAKKDLK